MRLSGVYAIAPTPFTDDGRVDTGSLDRLIAYYEETGVTGLTILGQMGEAPKLEAEESASIVARVLGRTRLPVVVGVSAPGFASMRRLTAASMDAGAAGVMMAPPSTLRSDDQIVSYYKNAAAAISDSVPVVVQDYPLTFSVVMSPAVITRLVNEIPGIVALKHEDWPGLEKISALRASERAGGSARRVRRAPAAAAVRAAAGTGARGPQVRHAGARADRLGLPAQSRGAAQPRGPGRGLVPEAAAGGRPGRGLREGPAVEGCLGRAQPGRSSGRFAASLPCSSPVDWPTSMR